jgi:hypothetical protein
MPSLARQIPFRLQPENEDQLRLLSAVMEVSMNKIVNDALSEYFKKKMKSAALKRKLTERLERMEQFNG